MTCVAAVIHDGVVYMGADSAGVADSFLTVRADAKVFTNKEFLIGFTSSFRMGNLLRYAFKPPTYRPDEQDLCEYMVVDFVNEVRNCLKKGGYAQINNGEETGGCFLVGFRGRLFQIESDYQVGESIETFNAVGCGRELALGALSVTSDLEPVKRIQVALTAAEKFNTGVRGPFVVCSISNAPVD